MRLMRLLRGEGRSNSGFSLAELSVILAVIGSLCVLSMPLFLTYYQSAQLRAAASGVASQLNLGRQMAIQRNTAVCVSIGTNALQYFLNTTCTGTPISGVTTDGSGYTADHEGITLTTSANPVFTNLGAAAPAATITVTRGSRTLHVSVTVSGRVTVIQ